MHTKDRLIVYHDPCLDGFTAAWAAWRRFQNTADYVGMNFGDEIPEQVMKFEGGPIYFLDVFPRDLQNFAELCDNHTHRIYIIDHHNDGDGALGAFCQGRGNVHYIHDSEKSGARLAWDQFCSEDSVGCPPNFIDGVLPLIAYVEDRDLWRWKLVDTEAITSYLFSYLPSKEFSVWSRISSDLMSTRKYHVISHGEILIQARNGIVDSACKNADTMTLTNPKDKEDTFRVAVVNSTIYQSEVGHRLLDIHPDVDVAVMYKHVENENITRISLRSRDGGKDVSEIARRNGGGGHKSAAGCEMSRDGWNQFFSRVLVSCEL